MVANLTKIYSFVRNLEDKIRELQRQLDDATTTAGTTTMSTIISPENNMDTGETDLADPDSPVFVVDATGFGNNVQHPTTRTETEMADSFPEELRSLSLQASAERYLGSSSGLSIAKLTQMILQRLSPDKADFVFDTMRRDDLQRHFDLDSPMDALNYIVNDFNVPFTSYQPLFADCFTNAPLQHQDILASVALPEANYMRQLVHFYFAHSHTLYPIIDQAEFASFVDQICAEPHSEPAQSPLSSFRLWMVLAIASTTYSSVTLADESESMVYYDKAMLYFESALGFDEIATLEVLALQVSYSFFNQLGPNTWFLVGLAARMAAGMGLHASSSYGACSFAVAQRRKRIFFSIYMMDRVVSIALGRPFALHDDDIDVDPFLDTDDLVNPGIQDISLLNNFRPSALAVPLHILALRRIASKIVKKVYSTQEAKRMNQEECDAIVHSLHKELLEWRRNMPFPLPDIHPNVPQLSSSWYDFNFYTHLAMLYRPSPLFPTLDASRIKILREAASMSIRQAINIHRQQRLAYNWLNLLAIFTSTISLIYAVTAQSDDLASVLKETKAINDLELVIELFGILERKFPAARNFRRMIEAVASKYKGLCGLQVDHVAPYQ